MSPVARLTPGSFCWPELATTDATSAVAFYSQLLGWTARETPVEGGVYRRFSKDGAAVAAAFDMPAVMRQRQIPPHWGAYVLVESAEDGAARVKAAGGEIVAGPFDVMDLGRTATAVDPQGAAFHLWQPRTHLGIAVANEPGALGWTQLNARDPEKAKAFYAAVFGWTVHDAPMGPGVTYTTWLKADGPAGGMMPMPPDVPAAAPSHWLTYFVATSVADSHARALSLGARSFVPPSEIPGGGQFAVLGDPQGAMFGLMAAM